MTLTGRAAQQHPDIDVLTSVVIALATHSITSDRQHDPLRETIGAARADVIGVVDPQTGAYHSAPNTVTEADRRMLGLRRNGRARRHPERPAGRP